jgi:hypothetical protein
MADGFRFVMGEVELKPCPFCGVEIHETPILGSAEEKLLVHDSTGCLLSLCHIPKDKIAAWNTRQALKDTSNAD